MDHTIVFCTRNRPNWVKYCLSFYENFNYKGKIFIADDSDEEIFRENKKTIARFENILSIYHIDGSGKNLKKRHQRLIMSRYDLVKKIDTKYFSIMTDDDFLFPKFLKNSIKFLESNNDYTMVTGIGIILYFNKSFEIKNIKKLYWPDNEENDPIDRLMKYIEPEYATLPTEGVVKTAVFNDVYLLEKKLNYKIGVRENLHGLETFDEEIPINSQLLISGKLKRIDEIANFVSKTEANSSNEEERVENLQFEDEENNELYRAYRVGPIHNILNNSMTPAIRQTKYELEELIKLKGSKYSEKVISDQLDFFLYRIITAHDGYTKFDKSDFFKKYLKQKQIQNKIKIKFNLINPYYFIKHYNFKKILNKFKRLIIGFQVSNIVNLYKDFHHKNKKIFN